VKIFQGTLGIIIELLNKRLLRWLGFINPIPHNFKGTESVMNKNDWILTILALTFLVVISLPLEIAMFKSWRCAFIDAVNWNGRIAG
jgi:hypothetical protein